MFSPMSDHWKVVEYYRNIMKTEVLYFSGVQQKNNLNALIVQSGNSSGPDAIIYAHDPMQNLGQTQIFDIA